jgi:sirohydrochlorin ferrochelatase
VTIALIDNGSLEPAAHRNLRAAAAGLSNRAGLPVAAVSWRHSDRVPAAALGGAPAWTLAPWVRAQLADGAREFLFVPFFINPQGAIGSALQADLESLARESGGFAFAFTGGLGPTADNPRGALAEIVAARVRETIAAGALRRPAVVVVDHGGPVRASADLRDRVAAETRAELGAAIGPLAAASMESPDGPGFAFNLPLLAQQLGAPGFASGDVVIAPLFLSPGRHAGDRGDLVRIARAAEARSPGLRCHFTGLVGTHPAAIENLGRALSMAIAQPII